MPVPELDHIRRPALELLEREARPLHVRDVAKLLALHFQLTESDQEELLPSGTQSKWHNRINWTCYDLYRAGMFERARRGVYQVNDRGRELLLSSAGTITRADLLAVSPEFRAFIDNSRKKSSATADSSPKEPHAVETTPEEQLNDAQVVLSESLRSDLLEQLSSVDPFRFEQIVIDLLLAMGYGGSRAEAAQVTRKSNDEGIDGVINEDRLGLDVIYVQAKRWKNTIGRKEIQSFVGALAGQQANKGVFITTSNFAATATEYASNVVQKVILIDGPRLADLMIEHNIGVSTVRTVEIKRLDTDYFEES